MCINSLKLKPFNRGLFDIYGESRVIRCIQKFPFLKTSTPSQTKTIIQSMKYYTGMMIKVFPFSPRKLDYKLSLVGLINIALSTHSSTFSLSCSRLDIITQPINFQLPDEYSAACFTLCIAQQDESWFLWEFCFVQSSWEFDWLGKKIRPDNINIPDLFRKIFFQFQIFLQFSVRNILERKNKKRRIKNSLQIKSYLPK